MSGMQNSSTTKKPIYYMVFQLQSILQKLSTMSRIDWNVIRFPIIFTSSSSSSSSITVQKSEFVILGSYFCRFVDILTLPCALAQIQKGDFVALVQLYLQGPFYMHLSAYNTLLTSSKGYRVGLQGMCNFQTGYPKIILMYITFLFM